MQLNLFDKGPRTLEENMLKKIQGLEAQKRINQDRDPARLGFKDPAVLEEFMARSKATRSIDIFTDGGCKGNQLGNENSIGAYGIMMNYRGHYKFIGSAFRETTNNRMEIKAITEGLRSLKPSVKKQTIRIFSDSKYSIEGATSWYKKWARLGWRRDKKGSEIKNVELWRELISMKEELESRGNLIEFYHIKGHSGQVGNEIADDICNYLMGEDKLLILEEA